MRVAAYIDGFSVYYACFKGPTIAHNKAFKWLDYRALIHALFPNDEITIVRLFTAIAPNPPDDPGQATRHDAYRRALMAHSAISVHSGRFQKTKREAILVHPPANTDSAQTVYVYQEKQSDVSLASYLLMDGVADTFDCAALITNDSDFVTPVSLVRERLHRDVIVISPDVTVSGALRKVASAGRVLDKTLFAGCQLPNPVIDSDGRAIWKPERWRVQSHSID